MMLAISCKIGPNEVPLQPGPSEKAIGSGGQSNSCSDNDIGLPMFTLEEVGVTSLEVFKNE